LSGQTKFSCSAPAFAKLSAEVLRMGKSVRFHAHGTSMRPLLRDGDVLRVEPTAGRRIKIGDVLLCQLSDEKLLVHRVIQRRQTDDGVQYLLKGDHVTEPDGWVSSNQVLGRLVAAERGDFCVSMRSIVVKLLGYSTIGQYQMEKRWGGSPFKHLQFIKGLPIFYRYLVQEEFNG
jgi:signal peptidase I